MEDVVGVVDESNTASRGLVEARGCVDRASHGTYRETLAQASESAKKWFEWSGRVGPLSGKTSMAVIVWLVAWIVLYFLMRHSRRETRSSLELPVKMLSASSSVRMGSGPVGRSDPRVD